jgi:hypothetical protein
MNTVEKILTGALQLLFAGAVLVIGYFVLMHVMSPSAPDAPPPQVKEPVKPQPTPNTYLEEDHYSDSSPTPTPSGKGDAIQYDANKKMKQEMLDRSMVDAAICAHNMVTSRLQIGIRSRQKITDEAVEVCTREFVVNTAIFGLGLTAEQIIAIVKKDIDEEIKMAENN